MTTKELNALKVGDVVIRHNKNGSVNTRVVRGVTDWRGIARCSRVSIDFVKLNRSRYISPTTIVYGQELLDRKYVATGRRMHLRSRLDKLVSRYLKSEHGIAGARKTCTQDDVVGVIS